MMQIKTKGIRKMKLAIPKNMTELKEMLREEKGMGVVEVILIVVVLVGLVFVFKDKMNTIVSGMFTSITDGINNVVS
jgi:Flp pilus assembly pilin Flp